MSILEKLHEIENAKIIYDIHYCRAGIGFLFYEPPTTLDVPENMYPKNWKDYLVVERYYDTFEEAVESEYKKLKAKNGKGKK